MLNIDLEIKIYIQIEIPEVGIESYDSHSVVLAIRPFINPDDYWDATYDTLGRIKKAFSDNNIKVAYSEGVELGQLERNLL